MKQSRFECLNGVMAIGFGKRFSRLRIQIFQFLRLTAEIYGCFTAFNPIKTLRFAFVGKNFIWREQLRTPKYCTQSKGNLEKGGISILTKEKACLIRKGLTMELQSRKNVVQARQLNAIPWDTLATERSIERDCAATVNYHDQMISQLAQPKKSLQKILVLNKQ